MRQRELQRDRGLGRENQRGDRARELERES